MDITYVSNFLGHLNKIRKASTYCDMTLKCDEQTWYCHRCVLASICPIIQKLLQSYSHSKTVVLTLPTCFKEILDELLDMLYTGDFNITPSNIEIICKFSIYMKISALREICSNFIKKSKPENMKAIKEIESLVETLPELGCSDHIPRQIKSRRKKYNKDFIYFNDNSEDTNLTTETKFTQNINESGKEFSNLTQVASEAYEDLKTKKTPSHHLSPSTIHHADSTLENDSALRINNNKIIGKNKRNGRHQCPHCEKIFKRKATMELHLRRAHTKVKPFQCSDCSKAFYLLRELKVHMRIHEKGHAFKCEECAKTFTTVEGYKRHLLHIHGPNTFHCDNEGCNFVCSAPIQLDRHRLKCALGDQQPPAKRHKCHICDAAFRWPHVMRRHVSSVHMRDRPHRCDVCEMTFNRKEQLREHTASHTLEKNYRCEVCGKGFRQQSGLCVHKKIHQNLDNMVCEICGHKCRSISALKIHHEVHLTERPFQCEHCKKTFKSNRQLKNHMTSNHNKSKSVVQNNNENIQQDSILPEIATENNSPQPGSSELLLQPLQLMVATPDHFLTQIQQNNIPFLQGLNSDDGNISAYFNNIQPQFTAFNEKNE